MNKFMDGDRVWWMGDQLGTIVGDPEGEEYPVEFEDEEQEIYYCHAKDLEIVAE